MTKNASQLVDELFKVEGGYVNDPNDAGGETNHGVTVAVARANGFTKPMREMTKEDARAIYLKQYWERPGFGKVYNVSPDIAAELFDTGVNMGPSVASKFLQRSLNVLNREKRDYFDIVADGQIGGETLSALMAYLGKRGEAGETRLLRALNALQGARYIELAELRSANETFVYGWLDRVSL